MRKILLGCTAILAGAIGYAGSNAAMAQSDASQAPGSIKVHLNGRVNWYAGVESSSLDNIGGTKTSTDNFYGYMRLYPGFDGVAANGLHYGAASEIRENSGENASSETLFVHQAYGYLGLPQLGQISFGSQNGPNVLFQTGAFEDFNDGGWNGDIEAMVPGAAIPLYGWADGNSNYSESTDKIVYLSPTISGFQFAVGFTPNKTAANYSPAVTSSTTPISGGQPRNLIDVGGQYTNTFGPVGIQAGVDYSYAGQVAYTGAAETNSVNSYHNLSIVQGGVTASFAGFTVGGNSEYGNFNVADSYDINLAPSGSSKAVGWLVGAEYKTGPLLVGASFFRLNQTGDLPGGIDAGSGASITSDGLTSGQQQNTGVAVGGTYTLVPGVNLFVDYLYGMRQQGGYDFSTGDAGTQHNNVQSQLFGFGTQIQW